MSDIFISYSREDRPRAKLIAEELEREAAEEKPLFDEEALAEAGEEAEPHDSTDDRVSRRDGKTQKCGQVEPDTRRKQRCQHPQDEKVGLSLKNRRMASDSPVLIKPLLT